MEDVQFSHVPPDRSPGVDGGQRPRDNRTGDRNDHRGMNRLSAYQILILLYSESQQFFDALIAAQRRAPVVMAGLVPASAQRRRRDASPSVGTQFFPPPEFFIPLRPRVSRLAGSANGTCPTSQFRQGRLDASGPAAERLHCGHQSMNQALMMPSAQRTSPKLFPDYAATSASFSRR